MEPDPKAGQAAGTSSFDLAAARLFDALAPGARNNASRQDVETVGLSLRRLLHRSYGLSETDAEEAAQDVILKVIEMSDDPATEKLEEIRNPGAYLTKLARNRAVDQMRRRARRDVELSDHLSETVPSHDDQIAALLDATATAASVRAAMRAASKANDSLTLRVISTWLDLADELGEPPSSRTVADRAKVSHTTVNQALRRFKAYIKVG